MCIFERTVRVCADQTEGKLVYMLVCVCECGLNALSLERVHFFGVFTVPVLALRDHVSATSNRAK